MKIVKKPFINYEWFFSIKSSLLLSEFEVRINLSELSIPLTKTNVISTARPINMNERISLFHLLFVISFIKKNKVSLNQIYK